MVSKYVRHKNVMLLPVYVMSFPFDPFHTKAIKGNITNKMNP